jgi:hypothetical protein
MGQHLGDNTNQNALRKHLKKMDLEPEDCERFDLVCYGPLFSEINEPGMDRNGLMERHLPIRNIVGALEKALADALSQSGYKVLNTVKWPHNLDLSLWRSVKTAFSLDFPRLSALAE